MSPVLSVRSLRANGAPVGIRSLIAGLCLATLVAAEHALLLVSSILPDGARRMNEAAPLAIAAAEGRLAMFAVAADPEVDG